MRHYELVLIFHPDHNDQVQTSFAAYKKSIVDSGGKIHLEEDWGRRKLAYPINGAMKAQYFMLNIECGDQIVSKLGDQFKTNDAILRHVFLRREAVRKEPSGVIKEMNRPASRFDHKDRDHK